MAMCSFSLKRKKQTVVRYSLAFARKIEVLTAAIRSKVAPVPVKSGFTCSCCDSHKQQVFGEGSFEVEVSLKVVKRCLWYSLKKIFLHFRVEELNPSPFLLIEKSWN